VFASICLFSFLVNFGRVAFAPLVDPFMSIFGVAEGTAGLVATTVWLGSAASRLPTGFVLTRVKRRHAILGMGVFLTLAAAATATAPTITLVGVGAFLVGIASGVFYIAANPLVSELYPHRVGWAVGIRGTSSQLAAVSAPVLVGVALVVGQWWWVFAALAALALVATLLFGLASRRADMPEAGTEHRDLVAAAREQWRLVLAGVAIVGVVGFVWQGTFNFYVTYLTDVKGVADATARTMLTVMFGAGVPAFFLSGRLADRFRPLPLAFAILGSFATLLLVLTAVEGVLAIAAVSLCIGYVIHSLFPVVDTYMLGTLPDHNRASAYAVYSATMMFLQAPGSVALGSLVEAGVPFTTAFRGYALVVVGVLAVLVALYTDDRLPRGA
jgi:predicted MFS family arabinose efflux permease